MVVKLEAVQIATAKTALVIIVIVKL
jgi:hypothetical protein